MMTYIHTCFDFIKRHKTLSIIIALSVFGSGAYFLTRDTDGTSSSIISEAKRRDIVLAVTGTGQVLPEQHVDIKPKVSGEIVSISAVHGTRLEKGAVIARLDATDPAASLRDARNSYETSRLSYEKYISQNSPEKLEAARVKAYDDAHRALVEYFAEAPKVLDELEKTMAADSFSLSLVRLHGGDRGVAMRERAEVSYYAAEAQGDATLKQYRRITRLSTREEVDSALHGAYRTIVTLADAVKAFRDLADYLYSESGNSSTYSIIQSTLFNQAKIVNERSADLLAVSTKIEDAKESAQDVVYGEKSSFLALKDKEYAVADAESRLADYVIRAPFAGVFSLGDIKVGDSVSSGSVVGSLMGEQLIAEISLNEVDAANVSVGRKAHITFDAIADLRISGEVVEVDIIGTESQGVVTYNAKIRLDRIDERIKPGMTISAEIEVGKKENVIAVIASAIKKQGGKAFVEIPDEQEHVSASPKPVELMLATKRIPVTVGFSNDEYVEIVEGLSVDQLYVSRTVTQSQATGVNTNNVRMPGIPGQNTRSR